MRAISLPVLGLMGFLPAIALLPAQEAPKADPGNYGRLVRQGYTLYQDGKYVDALMKAEEAIAMQPRGIGGLDLKAQSLVKLKRVDEAADLFGKIAEIHPDKEDVVTYNIGECRFLKGDYKTAQENFKIFVNRAPNLYLKDFVKYKIFVTHLKLNQAEDVKVMLSTFQPTPYSPVYYYAHAAERFAHGDADGGYQWIADGYHIYPIAQNREFSDSLISLGWITDEKLVWEMAQRREERAAKMHDTVDVIKDLRTPEAPTGKGLLE
jgi:tetratricopeptide (TPR) repeat protein